MNDFKQYIDLRGASLSQISELLPFYALPYVGTPLSHPTFQHLFSEEWVEDLKSRVRHFLSESLPLVPRPMLVQMYSQYLERRSQQVPLQGLETYKSALSESN